MMCFFFIIIIKGVLNCFFVVLEGKEGGVLLEGGMYILLLFDWG